VGIGVARSVDGAVAGRYDRRAVDHAGPLGAHEVAVRGVGVHTGIWVRAGGKPLGSGVMMRAGLEFGAPAKVTVARSRFWLAEATSCTAGYRVVHSAIDRPDLSLDFRRLDRPDRSYIRHQGEGIAARPTSVEVPAMATTRSRSDWPIALRPLLFATITGNTPAVATRVGYRDHGAARSPGGDPLSL